MVAKGIAERTTATISNTSYYKIFRSYNTASIFKLLQHEKFYHCSQNSNVYNQWKTTQYKYLAMVEIIAMAWNLNAHLSQGQYVV